MRAGSGNDGSRKGGRRRQRGWACEAPAVAVEGGSACEVSSRTHERLLETHFSWVRRLCCATRLVEPTLLSVCSEGWSISSSRPDQIPFWTRTEISRPDCVTSGSFEPTSAPVRVRSTSLPSSPSTLTTPSYPSYSSLLHQWIPSRRLPGSLLLSPKMPSPLTVRRFYFRPQPPCFHLGALADPAQTPSSGWLYPVYGITYFLSHSKLQKPLLKMIGPSLLISYVNSLWCLTTFELPP